MKVYLTPKTLKKIIKLLILFILACILIFYSQTLNVKAYTISNDSIYVCDFSDNVSTGLYNYIIDGDYYTGYFGTLYQGAISSFSTRFNAQIDQGHSYTLEIISNNGDFRNISANSIQVFGGIGTHCSSNLNAYAITSVSSTYYKITINFIANSTNNYSQLVIYNSDSSLITGVSNFKIDSMVLIDLGNSTTNDIINNQNQQTQTIIDNNTQNKNEIINNQNQSTQDIINNQNENNQNVIENNTQNTQDIIDNQNKNNEELKETLDDSFGNNCKIYNLNLTSQNIVTNNSILHSDGSIISAEGWGISNYYQIYGGYTYNLTKNYKGSSPSIVFYDSNKNYVTGISFNSQTSINFSLSENVKYFRITLANSISSGDDATAVIISSTEICTNKLDDFNQTQQETNDKLDNLQDSITNSTSPSTSNLENAAGWLPPGPVDSLVNLPINLLNSLLGNMGTTCTNINLTLPFVNKNFTIPCPTNLLGRLGDNFLTFWEGFGLIAGCWCLYKYFIALYKWVESALTLDEKEQLGKWGGV